MSNLLIKYFIFINNQPYIYFHEIYCLIQLFIEYYEKNNFRNILPLQINVFLLYLPNDFILLYF